MAVGVGPLLAQNPPRRAKVCIIGASVSAGFEDLTSRQADGSVNRSYRLDVALRKAWPRALARVYNLSNPLMFRGPAESGRQQIDAAKRVAPDLVLAVDFPFWFGYGRSPRGADDQIEASRLALQQRGLSLLAELECPLLIGDYPDMRGASTKMLPRAVIPNRRTIEALNAALRAWAKPRRNVQVLSLAEFVEAAVTKDQTMAFGARQVVFPKNFLLQSDRLHATRIGMLVLVTQLTQLLPQVLAPEHPLLGPRVTLKGLVEAADLESDLPELSRR